MLFVLAVIGGALMIGSCLALAFEDVIEAKSNLSEMSEERAN